MKADEQTVPPWTKDPKKQQKNLKNIIDRPKQNPNTHPTIFDYPNTNPFHSPYRKKNFAAIANILDQISENTKVTPTHCVSTRRICDKYARTCTDSRQPTVD